MPHAKFFETKKGIRRGIIIAGVIITVVLLYGVFRFLTLPPLNLKPGVVFEASYKVPGGPYHIGDIIPLELDVASVPGVKYRMPDLAVAGLDRLEIKKSQGESSEWRRGGRFVRVRYKVVAWNVGAYTLPGFTLPYQKGEFKGTYAVKPLRLKVISVLPPGKATAELLKLSVKGIKGPLELPPRYVILWWSLGILAVLVLIVLAIRQLQLYLKQRQKTPNVEQRLQAPVTREPAHLIALRRLDDLEKDDYPAGGAFKPYYSELSEIIREYMENRFQTKALEMTTEEFLSCITGSGVLGRSQQILLRDFLVTADLVKFAKQIPAENEARQDLTRIRRLVTDTTPPGMENQHLEPAAEI